MEFKPLFRGALVRLAAPSPDDAAMFAKWSENDQYLRIADNDPARPLSPQQYAEWEQAVFGRGGGNSSFFFRLRTLADDKLIGMAGLGDVQLMHRTAMFGITIGDPEYWGRGYGTDAARLILNYAFNELNLYRVYTSTIGYNERAARAYEKAGFKREGAWRSAIERECKRYDVIHFGLLREEWPPKP